MEDMAYRTATELVVAMSTGELSAREVLEHHLDRIERLNPTINAVVTMDVDAARQAADAADRAQAAGDPLGPLHGLPMTVKDCIEVAGMTATAGAPELADYVPAADALAVGRLRAAGAIIVGKTNLPAWAGDCQTYNDVFGTTNNPWDLARTPGGSSGGAAAAIAAGLSSLELGSDLGGSIRIPAHFCGVYGMKPSYGIVPLHGHIPPPPGTLAEIDVASLGPLARSADDLEMVLDVIAGPDAVRAVAWSLRLPPPRAASLDGYRLAAWLDDPAGAIETESYRMLEEAVERLRAVGVRVDRISTGPDAQGSPAGSLPPGLTEGLDVAQRLIQAAVAHALPDGEYDRLRERALASSPEDRSGPVRWARNVTASARTVNLVSEQRARLRGRWAHVFRRYDAILCPVTPTPAFPHDHEPDVDARTVVVDGERRSYGDQFAWLQAIGVVYLPVVTAPLGRTAAGLPVGVQVVGPYLEDRTPVDVARRMASVVGGFMPPPGF